MSNMSIGVATIHSLTLQVDVNGITNYNDAEGEAPEATDQHEVQEPHASMRAHQRRHPNHAGGQLHERAIKREYFCLFWVRQ